MLLAVIILCVYGIVLEWVERQWGGWADYIGHGRAAREWWEGHLRTPHFLFEALTIACRALFGTRAFRSAALMAGDVSAVAAALATYAFWTWRLPPRNDRDCWVAALWCLGLQVAAPITLATIWTRNLYLGYVYPASTYHNPTTLLLKPLALLSFALTAKSLERSILDHASWKLVLAASAAGVLSALAKPSWLLCFLPGLALTILFDPRLRKRRSAFEVVAAVLLSGLCVLAWQYMFLYGDRGADQIIFTPQKWLSQYGFLAPLKLLLSIAYPLSVLIVFWKEVRQSPLMGLAWTTFACSLFLAYGFSETGSRTGHDNLGWSAQIALFVLFVASTITMVGTVRQAASDSLSRLMDSRTAVPIALFLLHVAGGAIWYATHFTKAGNWSWY
jgi:hypothetical protein